MLIGWDAADWKVIQPLMDQGKMPNTLRIVENGCMGKLSTLHPPLSPMLWTSIATGKRPFKHGIHGFSEPTRDGLGVTPVSSLSRTCKAIWNIFNQSGLRSAVVGWWPSHPAEPLNGVMVSDHFHRAQGPIRGKSGSLLETWPPLPGAVYPPQLLTTLAELRFHPDELIREMVEPFVPLVAEIDQETDRRLAALMKILAECVTIHSIATWVIENQSWDFFSVYYDAIDHFSHGFMKYHPPRQDWISERDFELYSGVVTRAYQLHDQMLGVLLQKAGPDTTVILMSDHGFHPDHLRPRSIPDLPAGPAIEHSEYGILAISGPGIRKDELIHGANLLDIVPTVLTLYGLPMGEDMDGRVLSGIFESQPKTNTIPSWENVPGNDGRHPADMIFDPIAAREALEQMVALGYIEKPSGDAEEDVATSVRELRFNLGESYQSADRHHEAIAIFKELYDADPDETRFALRYFVSCQALSKTAEMRRVVDDLDGRRRALFEEARSKYSKTDEATLGAEERREYQKIKKLARYAPAMVEYLKAQVLTAEKRYYEALECLGRVGDANLIRPGLLLKAGQLYGKLRRFREARAAFRRAVQIDPDNVHAYLGLGRLALRKKNYDAAVRYALQALQRLHHLPIGHFFLGKVLLGAGEHERAAASFRTAISQNPNFPQAHLFLAGLLERFLNDPEGSRAHRQEARRIRRKLRADDTQTGPVQRDDEFILDWKSAPSEAPLPESLVVVTGLPRAGTSMLMQMLAAGGMPVLTDNIREADEDNPKGYFEFEPVKKLMADASWLATAKGKAVKIVLPLLPSIPAGILLRVIVIERDLDEILASQAKMIERRGETVAATAERHDRLISEYQKTLHRVARWLKRRPGTSVLALQRNEILKNPLREAERVRQFLDGTVDPFKMAGVVDPALHRNRKG